MEQDTIPQVVKDDLFSQDHMQELKRRGDSQKYFEGAGDFRSGEGFGYLVGGGLSIVMGAFIFPIIMSGHSDSGIEKYLFPLLTLAGIFLAVKGIFLMRKEDKTPRIPISDERFDEIMAYDSEKAKKLAEQALVDAYGISPDSEFIHLIGPNYYTANRHIPLLWKVDQTGKIRYSNFALVTLVFDQEAAYSHTCILNHRDGIVSKSHPYRYELDEIK
ncbi:MAG: hypothetical protein PHC92_05295, partial [Syntrophomonadaceae bacterium]|nr:hypothetical protein [Syntrophomonadaceae bacterium]